MAIFSVLITSYHHCFTIAIVTITMMIILIMNMLTSIVYAVLQL